MHTLHTQKKMTFRPKRTRSSDPTTRISSPLKSLRNMWPLMIIFDFSGDKECFSKDLFLHLKVPLAENRDVR